MKILLIIGLAFSSFLAYSQNNQDTLYLLMPKCAVDEIISKNIYTYNTNYTDSLRLNLINSVHKEFGKSFAIIDYPLDTSEYNRLFKIYLYLTQNYKSKDEFDFLEIDSLLKSKQIRKSIIIYSNGFKRTKKNYNKEFAKDLLLSALTLGMFVVTPIESHTNIFFTIYDHYDKKVLYFKRKMANEIDPTLENEIDDPINTMYLRYLKTCNKK